MAKPTVCKTVYSPVRVRPRALVIRFVRYILIGYLDREIPFLGQLGEVALVVSALD